MRTRYLHPPTASDASATTRPPREKARYKAPGEAEPLKTVEHRIPNGAGWVLSAFQTSQPARLDRGLAPVLIVPGYGMNSFIFSYHPRGVSLEGFLAEAGFEVWRADLRAQGASRWTGKTRSPWQRGRGGEDDFGLEDLALVDLDAVLRTVLERTETEAKRVSVIGASLGGTIMFIHAALHPGHCMGALVAVGSPVRWLDVHPVLRFAFGSETLVGLVRLRRTRDLAGLALPQLARFVPWVLSVYMNPNITDTSAARELVKTVEDPNRYINQEIARWIKARDLVVRGTNISEALRAVTEPLLCVLAQGDGIVPPATAAFPYRQVSSPVKQLLEVGSRELAMAHADLFISNVAHERVFEPVTRWLMENGRARA